MEIRFFSLVLLLLTLGCSRHEPSLEVDTFSKNTATGLSTGAALGGVVGSTGLVPGMVVGAAIGTVIGYDLQSRESLYLQKLDSIRSKGVWVQQEGDQIKFILKAEQLFSEDNDILKKSAKSLITLMGDFIKDLPSSVIQVYGFTSNQGSKQRNLALSRARAETVLKALQKEKLDTRLMFANGQGEQTLVLSEREPDKKDERIEIILDPID